MDYEYHIELMRFKPSGKYYDTVTFGTNSKAVFEVSDEIKAAFNSNQIPQYFDYLITGEGFPEGQGYPALLKLGTYLKQKKADQELAKVIDDVYRTVVG